MKKRYKPIDRALVEINLSLYPDLAKVRCLIGEVLLNLDRRAEALTCFESAVQYVISNKRCYGIYYQSHLDELVRFIRGLYDDFLLFRHPCEAMLAKYVVLGSTEISTMQPQLNTGTQEEVVKITNSTSNGKTTVISNGLYQPMHQTVPYRYGQPLVG